MLDIRRLRLLHELRRRGTIAAVAEALHFSPSAVSQQLSLLAAEAGVALLEPAGRGVRLTDAGTRLVADAATILDLLERAEVGLAATHGAPTGKVRIAAFQSVTRALIPRALELLRRHEALRVEVAQVEPERAVPALLAGDFDIVVAEEYPGAPAAVNGATHREELCRDPMRLAVPPGTRRVGLRRFSSHAWVMEPAGSASRQWATAMCRSAGFEPDVRYESDDLLTHVALVAHGHAAAFLPDLAWHGGASPVPLRPLRGQHRCLFTLVRPATVARPAVRAVRGTLRDLVTT